MECTKVGYNSFHEAQGALHRIANQHSYSNGRRINRQRKKSKKLRRTYKCDLCGKWHLTSQAKKINFKSKQ